MTIACSSSGMMNDRGLGRLPPLRQPRAAGPGVDFKGGILESLSLPLSPSFLPNPHFSGAASPQATSQAEPTVSKIGGNIWLFCHGLSVSAA